MSQPPEEHRAETAAAASCPLLSCEAQIGETHVGGGSAGKRRGTTNLFLLFLNHIKFEIILRNNRKKEREQCEKLKDSSCEKLKDSSIFIHTDQSEIFYLLYNFKNLQQLNYSQHCE